MKAVRGLVTLLWVLAVSVSLFAQCDNATGFMKKLCQTKANPAAMKTGNLTTSFTDTINQATLPPAVDGSRFESLRNLQRTDEGVFLLKAGLFEVHVETFALDTGNAVGGFYPAPIKGNRGAIIAEVLKNAELHPELSHDAIQELLSGIISGAELKKESVQAQQAGAALLSKEELGQIRGSGGGGQQVMSWIGKQLAKNPQVQQAVSGAQNKADEADQKYGVSDAIDSAATATSPSPAPTQASGFAIPRGAWVQMPDGFYVRYLPEGAGRMKVQLIVPESAVQYSEIHPIGFDPTQYVAVSGSPVVRLGIAMRQLR